MCCKLRKLFEKYFPTSVFVVVSELCFITSTTGGLNLLGSLNIKHEEKKTKLETISELNQCLCSG